MTVTVEDGSIVANADSYVSEADLTTFAARYDDVTLPGTDAGKASLLYKAMDFLERYTNRWKGSRVSDDQELEWPRSGVILYDSGPVLPETEIPRELRYAQMHLAIAAISSDLLPTRTPADKGPVIEETVHGAVTKRYDSPGSVLPVAADAAAMALINVLLERSGLTVVRA